MNSATRERPSRTAISPPTIATIVIGSSFLTSHST
jgi:hypothetical protein